MKILAFETSCDDTSIAIFENQKLLFMDTASQIKIHTKTGGVVPEVAAREHANNIFTVLQNVLDGAHASLEDIDYIAVTTNPGLIPSLLTGIVVANTLSKTKKIPIIEIDHIQAHIFANFLEREESEIQFPLVCLTVSGGHNDVYLMENMWDMQKIGTTKDDASGEAFDKVAKMMWLGYPGGPIISQLATEYQSPDEAGVGMNEPLFPRVWLTKKEADFSFSGLKSSVKREIDARGELTLEDKKEIAYEFENAVTEVLSYKLVQAAEQRGIKNILLAGGVSANTKLRDNISDLALKKWLHFQYPTKLTYCMDNAAMIGILGYYRIQYKKFEHKIGGVSI